MKIAFVCTGGTIDKDYPKRTGGYAFEISQPAVERILKKLNPVFDYEVIHLLKKDSQDITKDDRNKILECCLELENDKIIITHGTDTMIETAQHLSQIKDKIIVITGAMKPEKFSDSDASVNIGVAIGALIVLKSGVYIVMNGGLFPWDRVKRNPDTDKFVEL